MSDNYYAIYSPSKDAWRNPDRSYGLCAGAEQFSCPDECVMLDSDDRWVGPIAEGDYK